MASKPFDSVIIGFDGSAQSADAVAVGGLMGSLGSSGIVLAYIALHKPPFERQTREYAQARRQHVDTVLEPALAAFEGRERVEPASIDSSSPARGLHDLAHEYGKYGSCLLAIGSAHRGPFGRVLLGSVGEGLISGCPCPIVVAPRGFSERAPKSFARVVAGFDASPESRRALRVAAELAAAAGVELEAVAVHHSSRLGHGNGGGDHREELQQALDAAVGGLDAKGTLVEGDPVERLAAAAGGEDLLVLGARNWGPHQHVFVGSVSSKLVRTAPSPVLVLPRGTAEGDQP